MNTLNKKIAIVLTQAPFSAQGIKDALDLALIFGSFECDPALFYQDDAVFILSGTHDAEKIQLKDHLATFRALPFYDVEQFYVCQQSLVQRNLPNHFTLDTAIVLDKPEFTQQLHQYDVIFRF
jgi:tRNA 2-thiouridine synthesizing protein C